MRNVFLVALVVAAFVSPAVALAQATAAQGAPEVQHFNSPMLLEFPVGSMTKEIHWIDGILLEVKEDLSRFACDGVSLSSVTVEPSRIRKGNVRFKFNVSFRNVPGHDKLVNLRLQATRNDDPISEEVWIRKVDVEEGKPPVTRSVVLPIPVDKLKGEGPDVVIKMRMDAMSH